MQWEIGVLTLGDGRLEPFGLLKLYWTPYTPWEGGAWVAGVTLGDCLCCCGVWVFDGWEGFSTGES